MSGGYELVCRRGGDGACSQITLSIVLLRLRQLTVIPAGYRYVLTMLTVGDSPDCIVRTIVERSFSPGTLQIVQSDVASSLTVIVIHPVADVSTALDILVTVRRTLPGTK